MRSFKRIEILVKVLWILCLIVFVLNNIGAVGCAIGLGVFAGVQGLAFNGKTIAQMLAEKNVSVNSAYTGLAIGIFNCIVGAFLSYYLYLFFKKHSDRGVIIDKPLVKETRKVSLVYIIVSLSAAVLSGIGIGIARAFDKSIHVNNGGFISLAFALCMLIVSLFLDYIADLNEQKKPEVEPEPAQVEDKEE